MLNEKLANFIIGMVTLVWIVNFGAVFVVEDYQPSESYNAIFLAIVGGVFALKNRTLNGDGKHRRRRKDRDSDDAR